MKVQKNYILLIVVLLSTKIEGFVHFVINAQNLVYSSYMSQRPFFRSGPAHNLTYGNHKRSINFRLSQIPGSTTLIKDNYHMFGIRIELKLYGVKWNWNCVSNSFYFKYQLT